MSVMVIKTRSRYEMIRRMREKVRVICIKISIER
jgi:hypothetical protein